MTQPTSQQPAPLTTTHADPPWQVVAPYVVTILLFWSAQYFVAMTMTRWVLLVKGQQLTRVRRVSAKGPIQRALA